jgi:hypothetical protein
MPSTRFLFWNINRKPLAEAVADLAEAHAVDVVVLAESTMEPGILIQALNTSRTAGFQFPRGLSRYVTIFTRFSREFIQPIFESERVRPGPCKGANIGSSTTQCGGILAIFAETRREHTTTTAQST